MKTTLNTFLTDVQIAKAAKMYIQLSGSGKFAQAVCEGIITPNLPEINRKLGQENDPMYLAYAVEYVFNEGGRR